MAQPHNRNSEPFVGGVRIRRRALHLARGVERCELYLSFGHTAEESGRLLFSRLHPGLKQARSCKGRRSSDYVSTSVNRHGLSLTHRPLLPQHPRSTDKLMPLTAFTYPKTYCSLAQS